MCDENTDKGHKTCLVKTKTIYKPVLGQNDSYLRSEEPTDEKEISRAFINLTDFDYEIKDVSGKKVRVGKTDERDVGETESNTGSHGSRGIRTDVYYKRSFFEDPGQSTRTKYLYESNIYNEDSMLPKMEANSKNVLVGIEVCLYQAGHEDFNRVAKITGMYFTDIWNISDKAKFMAHVDEKVSDDPEYNLHQWIPSIYQSDLFFSDKVLGDKKAEKTKSPAERVEMEIKGQSHTSIYGNRKLIMAPKGQAITGVRFYNTSDGNRAIEGIELEFSSFYDRKTNPKNYKNLLNGVVKDGQFQAGLNATKIFSIPCNDNEYIQQLWFSYANEEESTSVPKLAQIIGGIQAAFTGDITITGTKPKQFGVKAIIGANKLIVENMEAMQTWIREIDNIRTCDMTGETLYDDDTIEYIYAKFIKQQFLYLDGSPSNNCKRILSEYCNTTAVEPVVDEALYEEGINELKSSLTGDIIISRDDLDLQSPNEIYSLRIGFCELCPTEILSNTLNIMWNKTIPHWISNPSYLKDNYNYSCKYQEDCSSSIAFTKDGNLILFSDLSGYRQNRSIWEAKNSPGFTQGSGGPYTLRMHNTGNLLILDKNMNITWTSGSRNLQQTATVSKNIEKKLFYQACALNDINCDTGINTFCSKAQYSMEIPLVFKANYTDYDRKNPLWAPKSFSEVVEEKTRKIKVPIIANVYTDKICPCTLPESDEIMNNIKAYYEELIPLFQRQSTTLENNSTEKEILEKDLIRIRNNINEVKLYHALASYDESLKLRLLGEQYNNITKDSGGKLRQQCSFPWCAKSNYKLFSMKQNINSKPCNPTEACMGGGFVIFSPEDPGYKVMCNRQVGAKSTACVMNDKTIGSTKFKLIDPSVALIPYPKDFLNCKKIFDPSYTPKTEWVPSFCELGDVDIEDESSYECLPDPSNNNIKSFFAKRPVYTPEIPIGMEGLCPPPWDLDKLYVNTGKECEPFDCSINLQSAVRGACDSDGYQTIEYNVIPNNSLGKICNEMAEKLINPGLSAEEKSEGIFWSELTKDDEKNYISATIKCKIPTKTCPVGQVLQNNTCITPPSPTKTCPAGQRLENNTCVNIVTPPSPTPSKTCPAGQRLENNTCVNICPTGQRLENNTCVNIVTPPSPTPSKTCPAGQRFEDKTCVNICPHGQILYDKTCVNICPQGQRFENDTCVDICPQGQRFENDTCVDICPQGQRFENYTCVNDEMSGQVKVKSTKSSTKTLLLSILVLLFLLIIFFFFFFLY